VYHEISQTPSKRNLLNWGWSWTIIFKPESRYVVQ